MYAGQYHRNPLSATPQTDRRTWGRHNPHVFRYVTLMWKPEGEPVTEPRTAPALPRIAIAGGSGFIGRWTTRALVARGERVAVLSHDPARARRRLGEIGAHVTVRYADALDPLSFADALRGIEVVINAMQFPGFPVEQPRRGWTFDAVDRQGTEWLLAAAKAAGVRRFIYLSGVTVDADGPLPPEPWNRAKWYAEHAVRESGLDWTILRPGWVYSADDKTLNLIAAQARYSPSIVVIGRERQMVQPVFVGDLAAVIADCVTRAETVGQTYAIVGTEAIEIADLYRAVQRALGVSRPIIRVPKAVPKAVAAIAMLLPRRLLTPGAIDFVTASATADPSPAARVFGTPFRSLDEGLMYLHGR